MKVLNNTAQQGKLFLTVLMFSILLQSCTVTGSITNNPANTDCPSGGKRLCHTETHWIFFWGLTNNKEFIANCGDGNMTTVEVKNNYLFTAVSFLTLGIITPQKLEWNCGIKEPCPEDPI